MPSSAQQAPLPGLRPSSLYPVSAPYVPCAHPARLAPRPSTPVSRVSKSLHRVHAGCLAPPSPRVPRAYPARTPRLQSSAPSPAPSFAAPESDPLRLDHLYRSGLVGHTHEPRGNSGAHLEPCSHSSSRPTPVPCLGPVLAWLAPCKELGSRLGSQLAVGLATATPSRALVHACKEAHPRSAGLFSPVGLHSSYLVG